VEIRYPPLNCPPFSLSLSLSLDRPAMGFGEMRERRDHVAAPSNRALTTSVWERRRPEGRIKTEKETRRAADHLHLHPAVTFYDRVGVSLSSGRARRYFSSPEGGGGGRIFTVASGRGARCSVAVCTDGRTSLISFGLIISLGRSWLLPSRYVKTAEGDPRVATRPRQRGRTRRVEKISKNG